MIKKIIVIALLVSVNTWAGLIEDGIAEARKNNNTQALELFEQACNIEKTAQGCFFSGQAYAKGTVVKKDTLKAFDFFSKSCDLGFTDGCMVVGSDYYYGREVEKDYTQAIIYFSKACEQADPNGCFLLGSIYDLGKGVPRDVEKGKSLYKEACEYGSEKACEYTKQMESN